MIRILTTYRDIALAVCLILSSGCDRSTRQSDDGTDVSPVVDPTRPTVPTIQDARRAINAGQVDQAEKIARELLIADPSNLDAGLVLAGLAVRRSDSNEAAAVLLRLAESHPEKQHLLQAQAAEYLYQNNNPDRAIEILSNVVENQPGQLDIRRRLAEILNSRGLRFDANEHLRHLAGRMTLTPRELTALINPLLTWASFSEKPSIDDLEFISRQGMLNVVAALRANGDVRDALTVLRESELLKRNHPAAVAMHGWLLTANQDFDSAQQWAAANAHDECRRYPAYWLAMGNLMLHLKRESAVMCFIEALRLEPGATEALTGLSQSLAGLNRSDLEAAVQQRQKAINESQALAYHLGSSEQPNPALAIEIGRVLTSIGRPIESLAWQESIYSMVDAAAPELEVLRQHKSKVLEQLPGGQNRSLIVCGIDSDSFTSVDSDLVALRSDAVATPDLAPKSHERESLNRPPATRPSTPVFRNVASSVGIEMRHINAQPPVEKEFRLFEALGSGVACLDFDLDGNVDLYLGQAGGEPPRGASTESNRLMRNVVDHFLDATLNSESEDFGYTHGVTAGDWNQDGFADLIVGNVGVNRLLINCGDGTFRVATTETGDLPEQWNLPQVTTSLAIADLTGDSIPDVFETNYVDDPKVYDPIEYNESGKPIVLPGPKHFNAAVARLFHTLPEGRLTVETLAPGASAASTGLGVLVTDLDDDGSNEAFVANDQNPNHLWKRQNSPAATQWVDVAVARGCAFGTGGKPFACMGIAAADFDRNGRLDLHVTNFNGECSNLYLQDSAGNFADRALAYRLDEPTVAMVGFGTQAFDYDNNSSIDLVVGNGHIEDFQFKGKPFRMPTQILAQGDNQFRSMDVQGDAEYWSALHLARAVAILDWNHDGRVDIAITDLKDDFALLENRTETDNHFLQLQLVGTHCERDAIGATVTVQAGGQVFVAAVQTGDGYMCRNEAVLHFGLGDSMSVDQVTVRWPGGVSETFDDIEIDSRALLIEGQNDRPRTRQMRP